MNVIVTELSQIKGVVRGQARTEIVPAEAGNPGRGSGSEEDMVVTISAGYVKRTPVTTYRAQKRGRKEAGGMEARERTG
ncbi:MAG: hypothetical protein R3F14_27430 [Polyangiaceae bacterium]